MSYLMGELLMYFIGTALLGIIVGWLFTRASYKRKVEDAEVVLLRQLHDVTKKLDFTQQQLDNTIDALEQERSRETGNSAEFEQLKIELSETKNQFNDRKQQVLDLNQSLDEANRQLQLAEAKVEELQLEKQKMNRDFDAVKNRLSVFENDLDEIVEQSSILRSAFEKARLELVTKDKRLAELESMSLSSEGLQMAAMSGNAEPELAISRIARLQTRVQELFDEVNKKDKELERLKTSSDTSEQRSEITNIADLQADDLQQIGSIGSYLEEKLNRLGITRFKDIASWDDSDIDRFDQELDFQGRIRRENWVEQARQLSQSPSSKFRGH